MEVSELKKQVRDVFDPLAARLGLSGPVEASFTPTNFRLGYASKALGIEVEVEMADFFIYVLLYHPKGDGLPCGYRDERGNRKKLYIQQALKELSVDVKQETVAIQKLGGDYRNCRTMAEMLVQLIEQHWSKLSQNTSLWFSKK